MTLYVYRAIPLAAHDADTIDVDIDLGFGVWMRGQRLRLYGINAWEVSPNKARGISPVEVQNGIVARNVVRAILGLPGSPREILIETHKDTKEKYGRWLARVFIPNTTLPEIGPTPLGALVTELGPKPEGTADRWELNTWLVDAGHAKYASY